MTLIPELRAELAALAERGARRRRRWFFGLTPVALVATTTVALAAGGVISIGSPAKDPVALGVAKPDADTGVVVKGTDRLLSPRADDPDGGPPWGLRLYSTTRGLGCMMPGRVVSGKIGVYGRYGAFNNDGRLHPFAPEVVGNSFSNCAPLDASGRLFLSVNDGMLVASASRTEPCTPRIGSKDAPGLCAAGTERTVLYGTLGPQAKSVTYTSPTGPQTVPTSGPEGAYLIVLPSGNDFSNGTVPALPAGGGDHRDRLPGRPHVHARDARVPRRRHRLPAPGLPPTRAQAPDTGRDRRARHRDRPPGPALLGAAREVPRAGRGRGRHRGLQRPHLPAGKTGRSATAVVQRNVKAGELVEQVFQHLNGGGTYKLRVTHSQASDPWQPDPTGPNEVTVGRKRLQIG